jgi:hypothetical protein
MMRRWGGGRAEMRGRPPLFPGHVGMGWGHVGMGEMAQAMPGL